MSDPTIVCVLGMHRSGTSLVARLLHVLGVELGPEEHLMGPSAANPTGHWEHEQINEINDELLLRLGGTWFEPPELPAGWESRPDLDDLRRQAREVIDSDFGDARRWGFKDPRTCLTLPFWQRMLPPMRYVLCLRNPVDVAFSLKNREDESQPFEHGVELWLTYVRAALAGAAAHPLEIVFYEDLMAEPEPMVRRLADFVGSDEPDAVEAYTRAAIRVAVTGSLHHHRSSVANVIDEPRLPFHAKALYLALRLFTPGVEGVGVEAIELLGNYAELAERQRADIERRIEERRTDLERMSEARAEEQRLRQEAEAELTTARRQLEETRAELEAAQAEAARLEELAAAAEAAEEQGANGEAGSDPAYLALVDEIVAQAEQAIPEDATVLVASKGDARLVELGARRAWHFPLGADGRYAGYHPAGDTAAIAQLEALRARGADHLLLPEPTLWWLDHYQGLRQHLEDRYELVARSDQCAIYGLRAARPESTSGPLEILTGAVASLRVRGGRDPSILDWATGLGITGRLPELPTFAPPGEGDALPYLDHSVDVVALSSGDPHRVAEARRVASSAIIRVDPEFPDTAEIEWVPGARSGWGDDVSVVLLSEEDGPDWEATRAAIAESLGHGFAGELTVVPSDSGAGLAERARRAAAAGGRSVQVFVTAPAVPLPGWLPSMLSLLARHEDAGVVGARILSPLGTLEEAGGVVAAGGSLRRRGAGDADPDRPEYCFVKRVNFCSSPLMATRSDLFERLGGFAEADDPVVDFSLRAGRLGVAVLYQPRARVVRIGNGSR